jgi:hypothetical protein
MAIYKINDNITTILNAAKPKWIYEYVNKYVYYIHAHMHIYIYKCMNTYTYTCK